MNNSLEPTPQQIRHRMRVRRINYYKAREQLRNLLRMSQNNRLHLID